MKKRTDVHLGRSIGIHAVRGIAFIGLVLAPLANSQTEDKNDSQTHRMPANLTLFLVRHAEKPDTGNALAPEGAARAQKYVEYFQSQVGYDGKPIHWNYLFASAESEKSDRPILTLQPLSEAIHVPIDSSFENKHFNDLVKELEKNKGRKFNNANVLICWHHGEILNLASALGINTANLPSSAHWPAKWPGSAYGWLLKIHFKSDGTLDQEHTEAVDEHLMPDDTKSPG